MKKFSLLFAFAAFFAMGMSAQTTNPPKKTPTPRAVVNQRPQAQATAQPQAEARPTDNSPAKNNVARGGGRKKHVPVKAATVSKPVDASTTPKQKVN